MSDTLTQPRKAQPRPGSKELRTLGGRFKSGYRWRRTGGGHWRVIDAHGEVVTLNGKAITISDSATGPVVMIDLADQLAAAGVLKGTKPRNTEATKQRRKATQEAVNAARRDRRQEEATILHDRLAHALRNVTSTDQPQLHRDLGYVGARIAQEQGKSMTPDLLAGSALRVLARGWVTPDYQAVWLELVTQLEAAPDSTGHWFTLLREAKGIDADRVHVRVPEKAEWPFTVELLPLEALFPDPAYQRPPNWPFVRKEAARFDHSLVGTIDVAQRSPSSFAILDGQQRTEIVRLAGVTSIYASVYVGLDHASEARFFLHKNRDRRNVHPFHLYRARLTAQDTTVQAIQAILDQHGYVTAIGAPTIDRPENVSAISALEIAYNRTQHDGTNALAPTLDVLRRAAYGRPWGTSGVLIRGVSRLLSENGVVDLDALASVVAERGPELIVGRARDVSRHSGGSAEQVLAAQLGMDYRRQAKRRGR